MRKLIIANWKMNGNISKIKHDLESYAQNPITNQDNIIFALPYVFLDNASQVQKIYGAQYKISSQDISQFDGFGAYTGEVSGTILSDLGVEYAIVGHSERRKIGETSDVLAKKLELAINNKITPIYCIGESYEDRVENNYLIKLEKELEILFELNQLVSNIIIAYEPIWAIGTGLTPSIAQIDEIMRLIKVTVKKNLPNAYVSTIYGGSVIADNTKDFLESSLVDGLLVGGASLKAEEFIKICSCGQSVMSTT